MGKPLRLTDLSPLGSENASFGACLVDFTQRCVLAVNDQIRQWIGEVGESVSFEQLCTLLPILDIYNAALADESSGLGECVYSCQIHLQPAESPPSQATVRLESMATRENRWHLVLIHLFLTPAQTNTHTDVVTGLPDRRALDLWRQQWQSNSPGKPLPHALLFLDLDDFKQINDQYGHACGDLILAHLAERWKNSLRSEDLVIRYGGDEFVILLAGVNSAEEATPVIERLKLCAAKPLPAEEREFTLSVSIGLALADDITSPIEELLARADRDMYSKKRHRTPTD